MMVLIYIFLALIGVGAYLAIGVAGIIFAGMLGLVVLGLSIRFWYIPAIILLSLCLIVFSLTGLLPWFLGVVITLISLALLVPSEKIEIEKEDDLSFWLPPRNTVGFINAGCLAICLMFFRYIANIQDWLGVLCASFFIVFIVDIILFNKRPSLFENK